MEEKIREIEAKVRLGSLLSMEGKFEDFSAAFMLCDIEVINWV